MKKYLKTIEDVETLRKTDTKIYCKNIDHWYCQFINGVLCRFFDDKTTVYNASMELNGNYYIEVEDEPSEDDIGKLGWFSDADKRDKDYASILLRVRDSEDYRFVCGKGTVWKYFTPLTPEEVEKHTGYKVVNNEMQASELANNKKQAKED